MHDTVLLVQAALPEPEIVTKNGNSVSVIFPINQDEEMLERLEDAENIAALRRARRRKLDNRPIEDVLADLAKS